MSEDTKSPFYRDYTLPLSKGYVQLRIPAQLSEADFGDFQDLMEIAMRAIGRSVIADPEVTAESESDVYSPGWYPEDGQ